MHIFKGPGSALFAGGILAASGLHFAQPSNGQLSPARRGGKFQGSWCLRPGLHGSPVPNQVRSRITPSGLWGRATGRRRRCGRACVSACARPSTRGMHQRRDALFLPQASQRPAGRVASRSQPPPPGWGSGQTIGPPLVTALVCVSVCVRTGVCVCVYPEGEELGEQGEDPLLGFPRRQAPGCIISCSSHSTTPPPPQEGTSILTVQETGAERATRGKRSLCMVKGRP